MVERHPGGRVTWQVENIRSVLPHSQERTHSHTQCTEEDVKEISEIDTLGLGYS